MLIEREGDDLVEISFGSVTLRAPRASAEQRARGIEESRRAMEGFAAAILSLPGIKLERRPGVPIFYADQEDPAFIIRELDGVRQRGKLVDGRFAEVE